jgi:hypothetical protein
MASSLKSRLAFYEKKLWPIQFILVVNGSKKLVTKDDALKLINGGVVK